MMKWYLGYLGEIPTKVSIVKKGNLNYDKSTGYLIRSKDLFDSERAAYLEKIKRAKKQITKLLCDIENYSHNV